MTPAEMRAVDAAAPEPVEVLVERAGAAVARAALRLLGGGYGRRVVVVAGKGNNGADGRAAARRLRRRGVAVTVVDAAAPPERLPAADLVVDAAYGTGFRGEYRAPDPRGAPVLAVDVPSGVDGLTGELRGAPPRAACTVTFAALKPGLVLLPGATCAGTVEVVDIGLDVSGAGAWLLEDGDVRAALPRRPRNAHKWQRAVAVVAGSAGMMGAPLLAARAAMRSGAGYVLLGVPGAAPGNLPPGLEAVGLPLPAEAWAGDVLPRLERCRALVVGPGLGRDAGTLAEVRRLVAASPVPVVVDGDGLRALEDRPVRAGAPVVLTPHDGEFAALAQHPPGADRIDAARSLAAAAGATVLLKGPATVVAPVRGGPALLATAGGPQLATAGTGDVLAGALAAFLAEGLEPAAAAAAAAHAHGSASLLGRERGLLAGDLPELLADWLSGG